MGQKSTAAIQSQRDVSAMQISLNVGTVGGSSPVDDTVNALAQLRDEGFRRVWMPQMPNDGDLLTVLAVALREVDTIEVGSAVLPIQNQHPMQLAQRALMLNLIAGGRFLLGLGMTHQAVTEAMWGIPYDKPLRRMREFLDGLQPLLVGQAADAVGETVTTRGAIQIPGAPAPDVYLETLARLKLGAADCVAIEDSRNGLIAASRANIPVLITRSMFFRDDDLSDARFVLDDLSALR